MLFRVNMGLPSSMLNVALSLPSSTILPGSVNLKKKQKTKNR